MDRTTQVSNSSDDEDSSSSDHTDADENESEYTLGSESNEDESNEASADSLSANIIKAARIIIDIKKKHTQDLLKNSFLINKSGIIRTEKRHAKSKATTPSTKKPRTRGAVAETNKKWKCGQCGYACVSMEMLTKHVETAHAQSKPLFYMCKLCDRFENALYSHYGNYHVIDFIENLLFDDGTLLVTSSVNTENGHAEWFKTQKKKAEERLQGFKCRLCEFETEFDSERELQHHYTEIHKVEPGCLNIVKYLFRVEKNAHLAGADKIDKSKNVSTKSGANSAGADKNDKSKNVSKSRASSARADKIEKSKNASIKAKVQSKKDIKRDCKIPSHVPDLGLIMYVCKCGVAKETYDASVEHAQKHLALDYLPNTQKCTRCNLTFESACFTDHKSCHVDKDATIEALRKIDYDYYTLFSENWFDMFQVLSKSHAEKIVASSLFKYTRSVKLTCDSNTGTPLYKCGMCELFVEPAKVENHSENYGACVNFDPKGHDCEICDISFSTDKALKLHKEDHKNGSFRIVVFNNKNDLQFNKALHTVQYDLHSEEDSQELIEQETIENSRPQTKPLEKSVDARATQLCTHCKKFVFDYNDHMAAHENERKKLMAALMRMEESCDNITKKAEETTEGPEQTFQNNNIMDHDGNEICTEHNSGNEDSANTDNRIDTESLDTVEPWNSDSDIGDGDQSTTEAQIHLNVIDFEKKVSKKALEGTR